MTDVTPILNAIEQGDAKAADELLLLAYEELRILSAQKLSRERLSHPLLRKIFCRTCPPYPAKLHIQINS